METIIIENFDKYFNQIKNFCKEAIIDCKNLTTKENLDYISWNTNSASLLNRLYIKKAFLMLTLLYDGEHLVGISGIETYNKEIALIGRRLFIFKKYRKGGSYHDYMLEPQVNFITDHGFKLGIVTVNKYKRGIFEIIKRSSQDKASSFTPHLYKYSDFIAIDTPVKFNHVMQYILGIYTNEKYKKEKILEGKHTNGQPCAICRIVNSNTRNRYSRWHLHDR